MSIESEITLEQPKETDELKLVSGAKELEQIADLVGNETALTTKCCASGTCD